MLSQADREYLESSHAVFCCEGAAEQALIELLLDRKRLIISDLGNVQISRHRGASKVEEKNLGFDFDRAVSILRIADSPREQFKLSKLYRDTVRVFSFYTKPEFEMLTIVAAGKYDEYTRKYRSSTRPSEYCKSVLGMSKVKSKEFINDYFAETGFLEKALVDYRSLSSQKEPCIADLLRSSYQH
ncbi:MAG: hypothetical protein FWE46_04220 [Coriobacteriia bacterium]|nr:hypothetical protein [Coriobacteriia bacterium]MCL2537189.1 hypothetical protein [Coriobacteriia bacterium]